jgi:hypothetical protein
MRRLWLAVIAVCAGIIVLGVRASSHPAQPPTYMPSLSFAAAGNSSDWIITKPAKNHEIEGYPAASSVAAGNILDFHISSATPAFSAAVYRMGWGDEKGAKKMFSFTQLRAQKFPVPAADAATGLLEANWPVSFHLRIPTSWPSGMYFVKLENASGAQSYIPFVVTAAPTAKYLFIHSDFTDQAYNDWGGNSLYRGSTAALNIPRAVKVSAQRPFEQHAGSGFFLLWEYPMVRFLEKEGYQLDYATDRDVHEHPELLQHYRAIIITGHDEYWSKQMRQAYTDAIASGVNVAIFGANTSYRQIRLEKSPAANQDDQVIVGYKGAYAQDPEYEKDESLSTTNWRATPVNQPESTVIGAMYSSQVDASYPLVISNPRHWIFSGTDLQAGDSLPGLVGYEVDRVFNEFPKPTGLTVLTQSPVRTKDGGADTAQATIYAAASGAQVFNAGTIQWSSGVDAYPHGKFVDARVQTITKNILDRFGAP